MSNLMELATATSTFKVGQRVIGKYCGRTYTGALNHKTHASVDGRNIIFNITLDESIVVFGTERTTIEIDTTEKDNTVYLFVL